MNTTTLRSPSIAARHPTAGAAPLAGWLRSTMHDFVAGLLSVTKASLLEQQPERPHLRRF